MCVKVKLWIILFTFPTPVVVVFVDVLVAISSAERLSFHSLVHSFGGDAKCEHK